MAGNDSRWLEFARNTAIGAAAWSLIWFFLGLAGLYRSGAAIALLLVGLALAGWRIIRVSSPSASAGALPGGRATDTVGFRNLEKVLVGLCFIPIALALIAARLRPDR